VHLRSRRDRHAWWAEATLGVPRAREAAARSVDRSNVAALDGDAYDLAVADAVDTVDGAVPKHGPGRRATRPARAPRGDTPRSRGQSRASARPSPRKSRRPPRPRRRSGKAIEDLLVVEAFPGAEVLLAQTPVCRHAETVRHGHRPRGLDGAREIAGVDGVECLVCQLGSESRGLLATSRVQGDVAVTLDAVRAIPVSLAVPHQEDRRGHGDLQP